jgi:hypothetical protein
VGKGGESIVKISRTTSVIIFMEKCNNVWENAEDEKRIAGTLKQISLATGWNYTKHIDIYIYSLV